MNIFLWILQVLLGLAFLAAKYNHGFKIEKAKTQMGWMSALPNSLLVFIGVSEILGGIGLILPAAAGILPALTAWAAVGLSTVMVLAVLFHATRREYQSIVVNLVLLALSAFVAYGRFVLVPF